MRVAAKCHESLSDVSAMLEADYCATMSAMHCSDNCATIARATLRHVGNAPECHVCHASAHASLNCPQWFLMRNLGPILGIMEGKYREFWNRIIREI